MSRSQTRTIRVPSPLLEALQRQMDDGVIDYDSLNAAVVGLITYQLVVGKGHPITSSISRMAPAQQDVVHDFLLEMTKRGQAFKGQLLNRMIYQALGRSAQTPRAIAAGQAKELLELAQRWKKGDSTVWQDVEMKHQVLQD